MAGLRQTILVRTDLGFSTQAKSTPDKYGRLLCTLFTIDGKTNINERMVTSGQAENY